MKNEYLGILAFVSIILSTSSFEVSAADLSAAKMTISANENYLRRFRKEREAYASAKDAESIKKLDSLDKKIKNLEMENARLSGTLQKKPSVSVAQPAIAVVSTLKPLPKAAVAVEASAVSAVGEWEKMSREEKENYVLSLVKSLKKEGRTIERHPLFYTAMMDYVFVSDATLAAKPLKDAVIATIQKNETSWRALPKS